ncbi:MAG TPA: sulfurtransferase-like selenium metabolism protein YedF [Desulfomonilaceae bacterium]|nr:sulfurtransferase-like selenium metabolism protein YedF [Desulfomonilaceae bacterium]
MNDIVTVDTRGLACPQPVLEIKKALEESGGNRFRVLVDNDTSRENVSRFARNQGCRVDVLKRGEQFEIAIERQDAIPEFPEEFLPCPVPEHRPGEEKKVIYIGSNAMGKGDDELGTKLMRGFLRTWLDTLPKPWRMIFINSGVKLTTVDEEAADAIVLLEEQGVEILSCGTCLQHFGLEDKLRAGKVTNMYEIIESLNTASKVITPD